MKKYKNIDSYIDSYPENVQSRLKQMRATIKSMAPRAEELISYGIPAFRHNGRNLVYFAGWKDHVSLYPIPEGSPTFKKQIAPYVAGRGTLKFLHGTRLPVPLIRKVVAEHMKINSRKKRKSV